MLPKPARAGGIVTALVTPLTSAGRLDVPGLERLIGGQLAAGVDGIFILGSVGEGPLLPDAVADEVAARAAARISGRIPLYGGASDNSVERCLGRIERLAGRGVNFCVLTLPFYGWPGRTRESVRFFADVAARSPLPLVAYNLPKAVGWQMPVETLEELFGIPNLVCLKDTHGNFEQMAAVASSPRRPAHFSYLPGNSAFAARLFRRGADGVVTTPANIHPGPFVDLWRHHRRGNAALVDRIDRELIGPLVRLLEAMPTGASAIKGLLELRGVCRRHTVAPWPEADESDLARMRTLLDDVGRAVSAFDSAKPGAA